MIDFGGFKLTFRGIAFFEELENFTVFQTGIHYTYAEINNFWTVKRHNSLMNICFFVS